MSTPILTRDILEGYVNCKYLAHLRLMGQAQPKADFEQVITEARLEQKLATAEKLRSRFGAENIATSTSASARTAARALKASSCQVSTPDQKASRAVTH